MHGLKVARPAGEPGGGAGDFKPDKKLGSLVYPMVCLQSLKEPEMAAATVEIKPFLLSLALVGSVETVIGVLADGVSAGSLSLLGAVRALEAAGICLIFNRQAGGMAAIGISKKTWRKGLRQGVLWSAGFGAIVLAGFAILLVAGIDPFSLLRMRLPAAASRLIGFILVGGLIGPAAEEILFRGVVFGYFRRWGFWTALIVSIAGFIAAHLSGSRLPLTQAVGGVVFGVAYEKTGSLVAPLTIHVLGNLAIFSLSIFWLDPAVA